MSSVIPSPIHPFVSSGGVFVPAMLNSWVCQIVHKILQAAARTFKWGERFAKTVAVAAGWTFSALSLIWLNNHTSLFTAHPSLLSLATIATTCVSIHFFRKRSAPPVNSLAKVVQTANTAPGSPTAQPEATFLKEIGRQEQTGDYIPLEGSDEAVANIERVLSRKPNGRGTLLVGNAASEPLWVMKECARRIASNALSPGSPLFHKRFYYLDARACANIPWGCLEKGLAPLAKQGNAILVLDNVDALVTRKDVCNVATLATCITSGEVTIVGITSPDHESEIASLPFGLDLTHIRVAPLSASACFSALRFENQRRDFTRINQHVTVTEDALALAALLAYQDGAKGFSLKSAETLIADVVFTLRNSSIPVLLDNPLFMQRWKELYAKDRLKISLASLDLVSKQFFEEKGIRVDSLTDLVLQFNKAKRSHFPESNIPPFLIDMHQEALEGRYRPYFGREEQMSEVIRVLRPSVGQSFVLLGEPGVGKTALLQELARRLAHKDSSVAKLKEGRFYWLDVHALLATDGYFGTLEKKVSALTTFCRENEGTVYLVCDEFHLLKGAGTYQGNLNDVFEMIKSDVASGRMVLIGATNRSKWAPIAQKDLALARRFTEISMSPPSQEECFQMLQLCNTKQFYTCDYEPPLVEVTPEAIREAVRLTEKWIPEKCNPDKAQRLIVATVGFYQEEEEGRLNGGASAAATLRKITPMDIATQLYRSIQQTLCGTTQEAFVRSEVPH